MPNIKFQKYHWAASAFLFIAGVFALGAFLSPDDSESFDYAELDRQVDILGRPDGPER